MSIMYQKKIEVRQSVDVFVAGGGPAGVAAALVAARAGKSVFLAEGEACFGGMGTSGLVPVFMMFGDGVNFLAGGIGREIYDKLNDMKGPKDAAISKTSCPAELMKRLYDRLLTEAGVKMSLMTQVVDIVKEGQEVKQLICHAKSGFFAIEAKMVVDCTGDGDICAWAGAPVEMDETMPGTLCSLWGYIDYEKRQQNPVNVHEQLMRAFEDGGIFTVNDPHHSGMFRIGEHTAGGNMGHAFGINALDEQSVTEHLIACRKMMPEFEAFYKKYIPGFENVTLLQTGALMGIRESRRIMGDYVLDMADFTARAVFDDELGRYCYPVDIHPSKPDPKLYAAFEKEFGKTGRYGKGESYGIPYRTLTPRNLDNVLVAGRCISTDRKLQGSIRVMPGCYITGQAAGMAACEALDKGTDIRGIDVHVLQKRLLDIGAFLPNFKQS
ncbi:MAG: FAD-dependent oxidoreductase [Victivallales bacterium]|nr:FAD-dependent oxidoreductase [Victivallales bacterium]